MADPLTFAGARPARVARPLVGAIELVGRSAAISHVQELVRRAAALEQNVLLVAERGAEIESVAREIHDQSRRAAAAYVAVQCDGCHAGRIDRLLFGDPVGWAPPDLESVSSDSRIAAARGGTLFLEEIADLPAAVQARLFRLVRDGEVRLDGEPVPTGFRLIASASSGVEADVRANRFRADLYRRLAVVRIDLPPLRSRAEDMPQLVEALLAELAAARQVPAAACTETALALMAGLPWPGNLSELRGVLESVLASAPGELIQIGHVLPALQFGDAPRPIVQPGNLREARLRFEREYIAAVLEHHGWRMSEAARTLGIQRPNLYRKVRQLGIPLTRVTDSAKETTS